jgi:hypothetical protein
MKEKNASQAVSDSVISQFFNASFHYFLPDYFYLEHQQFCSTSFYTNDLTIFQLGLT